MLHWSWIHPVQGLFLIVSNICCPFCARLFFSLRLLMTQISSAILCRCQDSWIHQHCKESSMLAIGFFAKLLIMPHLWFPLMWYSSAQVEWFGQSNCVVTDRLYRTLAPRSMQPLKCASYSGPRRCSGVGRYLTFAPRSMLLLTCASCWWWCLHHWLPRKVSFFTQCQTHCLNLRLCATYCGRRSHQ